MKILRINLLCSLDCIIICPILSIITCESGGLINTFNDAEVIYNHISSQTPHFPVSFPPVADLCIKDSLHLNFSLHFT